MVEGTMLRLNGVDSKGAVLRGWMLEVDRLRSH